MADGRENDIRTLWQGQPAEPLDTKREDIAHRAQGLQDSIRRRNVLEYAAALLVIAAFGAYIWLFPGLLTRLGAGLVIAGTVYVVVQLYRRGGVRALPADTAATCLEFHRQELVRQHELLRDVWRWYLGPFVPGLALFLAGRALEGPGGWLAPVVAGLACVLVLGAIWWLNARAAEALQHEIDALEALMRGE